MQLNAGSVCIHTQQRFWCIFAFPYTHCFGSVTTSIADAFFKQKLWSVKVQPVLKCTLWEGLQTVDRATRIKKVLPSLFTTDALITDKGLWWSVSALWICKLHVFTPCYTARDVTSSAVKTEHTWSLLSLTMPLSLLHTSNFLSFCQLIFILIGFHFFLSHFYCNNVVKVQSN